MIGMSQSRLLRTTLSWLLLWITIQCARGSGLNWPTNQLLPAFSAPAPVVYCIDVSSASGAQQDLFASLEGIVNRTQPRIACVSGSEEGKFTWLTLHNLPYLVTNGYSVLLAFKTNFTGLVVHDPSQPDTLNLATTIAGINNELICDPGLLSTLTNTPYNFSIQDDLRGRFATKYQVYNYLYTNCWPQCTHRIFAGMETNGHGNLRDYLVAVKSASAWLDPGSSSDAAALAPFISSMTPNNGVYMGWWPSEDKGLQWIAQYGIPVIASDWYGNGSLFGGVSTNINIPAIPPTPPLENKVYVSFTLSDGDNVQYMQHHMKVNWGNSGRGTVPVGWTVQPLSVVLDPGMLNYYWSTASTNDCLVGGPSGAGYTRINYWSSANATAYTKMSRPYMQSSGIRTITIWNTLSSSVGSSFAANCPSLIGLNDQNGGTYATSYSGLPVVGFPGNDNYTSTGPLLYSGITNAAVGWTGSAPKFIAVQGSGWNISPADCQTVMNSLKSLNSSEYVVVRPDHLFLLYKKWAGLGAAAAPPYVAVPPVSQTTNVGANVTLSAIVTGSAPLSIQWRLNGTAIAGATNNSYTRLNVQPSDSGNYSVYVTNLAGSVTSSIAALTIVSTAPRPPQVMTMAAASITAATATLNGAVVARGTNTVAWFEWGTTTNYSQRTAAMSVGSNFQSAITNASISGLTPGVIYHCRFDASNALGLTFGADKLITTGGRVKAWGDNSYNQTNVPPGLANIVSMTSGGYHGLALKNDGTLVGWGYNAEGQTNLSPNLTNVVAIAAGFYHSLALKADGTVTAWGGNTLSQLNGVTNLANIVAIAAGAYHSLAVKSDGSVVAWGYNNFGQTNVPGGLANATAVAAGIYHSMALTAVGTVAVWGANTYGQTNVPDGLTNVVDISSGEYHCLALKKDGTVVAWGYNNVGQTNVPASLTNVTAIACGDYFNLALKSDGSLVSWGDNTYGQINLPAGLTNVVQMAGGMFHAFAIGNMAPQALSLTNDGYVNHDLMVALRAVPGDGSLLNYRIATTPANGALYQYANGSRGALISLPDSPVIDSSGRVFFAATTNSTGNPYDNFTFVANDGLNDSTPATMTIDMAFPAAPQLQAPAWFTQAGQNFALDFQGSSNASYSIWGSTNLTAWNWLGNAEEASPGNYQFMDLSVSNWPARFYRISAP